MKNSVVFFGSGPVAAKSLEFLANKLTIEAAITKPATVKMMTQLAARTYAVSDRNQLDQLIASDPFSSRLAVLIDFGIIISRNTINYFPLGIINSHFSLLPEWRGADPITSSILSGQKETGVSLMLLNDKMDEGLLLSQAKLQITSNDTGTTLTNKLIDLSDQLLEYNLPAYVDGKINPYAQERNGASYSWKLTKSDGFIDWKKSALEIEREVRAFIEWPKSRTKIGDMEIIITVARALDTINVGQKIGQISIESRKIIAQTGQGSLEIERLKPIGRAEMSATEFIHGYGSRLELAN